jgi:hypothetical protein
VDPAEGGYGNGVLKFPLDLSKVEDFFIPANGVFLDNVRGPLTSAQALDSSCVPSSLVYMHARGKGNVYLMLSAI